MKSQQYDYQFKVILLGEFGTGKSSIFEKIFNGTCLNLEKFRRSKYGLIQYEIEYSNVVIKLWDTLQRERYGQIPSAYYKDSQAIVFVFDVSQQKTLLEIDKWLASANQYCTDEVIKILVGNKTDKRKKKRRITEEEGKAFASERKMTYYEISAKKDVNIQNGVFLQLAKELKKAQDKNNIPSKKYGSIPIRKPKYQSSCW